MLAETARSKPVAMLTTEAYWRQNVRISRAHFRSFLMTLNLPKSANQALPRFCAIKYRDLHVITQSLITNWFHLEAVNFYCSRKSRMRLGRYALRDVWRGALINHLRNQQHPWNRQLPRTKPHLKPISKANVCFFCFLLHPFRTGSFHVASLMI